MSWEGFAFFLALFIGGPLLLAVVLIGGVVGAVCSVPVGVAWALAATVRPQIITSKKKRPADPTAEQIARELCAGGHGCETCRSTGRICGNARDCAAAFTRYAGAMKQGAD